MLKDLLYAGIGTTIFIKEKVEKEIKKLEDEGKIKSDDAKSFIDSIKEKGKLEEQKSKDHLKKVLKEVIDELGIATKQDLINLKEDLK